MSIKKNTAYNLIGSIAPIFISLVTIPLYLSQIGEARYGIIAIVGIFLGYFGLFDLGLGKAVNQRISSVKNDAAAHNQIFWSAVVVNFSMGTMGGILLYLVAGWVFSSQIEMSSELKVEILGALPLLVIALPVITVSSVFSGVLQAKEDFLAINIFNVMVSAMIQVVPLAVAYFLYPELPLLISAIVVVRIMSLALFYSRARSLLPISLFNFSSVEARRLVSFGGWVTLTGVVGPLMVTFDRLLIGLISGPVAVTYYQLPFQLVTRIKLIPDAVTVAMFPKLVSDNEALRYKRSEKAIRFLSAILTPAIVVAVIAIHSFLTFWIDADFAKNAGMLGQILLLGVLFNCFARLPFTVLQAKGRPDLMAKCHVFELPFYLMVLYWSLEQWGVMGAAASWTLRTVVDCLLSFHFSRMHLLFFKWCLPSIVMVMMYLGLHVNQGFGWVTLGITFIFVIFWFWVSLPAGFISKELVSIKVGK
ncbi:MAG: flippase [Pseudomonadales bacterium]